MKAGIFTFVTAMLLGAVALASFNGIMAFTSTDDFCGGSCHEMEQPLQALQQTAHYKNSHGVAVHCSDCHIPKEFLPKMIRKVEASREVWGHLTGLIDTPEKYAAHRPAMRERELNRIRANDSQECRNCHSLEKMDFSTQERAVRRYHRGMEQRQKTCVDCHEGIAHPEA
jgi:cytochrome c-type protein NapC